MDWIHCNNCASQIGSEEGQNFVATNCGHIYCEYCTLLPELKQCRICHSSYQTMPISSKMNNEVEIYFRNPIGEIQKLMKVLEFQQDHRMRLIAINKEKLKAYTCLEKESLMMKEKFRRLQRENTLLRDENKRLNDMVLEYKRKIECFMDRPKARNTPDCGSSQNSYDAFRNRTPKFMKPENNVMSSGNHYTVLKPPAEKSNFFIMKTSQGDEHPFNSPTLSKLSGSFRSIKTMASDKSSPASPKTSFRDILSQKDQSYRRVKLPGDRGGLLQQEFRRYTLSKLSSGSKKDEQPYNKYSQYFNKK